MQLLKFTKNMMPPACAKTLFSIIIVSLVLCVVRADSPRKHNLFQRIGDVNGGVSCAVCTLVTGLAEQLTEIYNISVSEALSRFCNFLPTGFHEACTALVDEFGPTVIELLERKETPDVVCNAIDVCKKETSEVCHLFPLPKGVSNNEGLRSQIDRATKTARLIRKGKGFRFPDLCNISVVKPICELVERFANEHFPLEDVDDDDFSDVHTFRGSSWRGADCNDLDKNVYPGRFTTDDSVFDANCNGIHGVEPSSGQTYESLWCKGTKQMGTVILGDSVGAHFHLPPAWLTSRNLSVEAFQDLLFILENEIDWPMLSSATGYKNSTWKNIHGPVDSSYLRMRAINRCNHRDFQNIAVNGARSSAMANDIVKSFARHAKFDNPVFLTLALVGNDVCNGHPGMSHMTTPEEFYANNLKTLQYLDTILPSGSVVMAIGLVDGRVLYNSLHDRIHPIGSLHNDVTYAQMYNYLNCLQITPCFGWLNSNETWRNRTTERAMELNAALEALVKNVTFQNFKAHYFDPPIGLVFKRWEEQGGKPWELIEPVDGFHPNQIANALNTEVMWELMRNYTPEVIPPVNPFNSMIEKKFGDQGGY